MGERKLPTIWQASLPLISLGILLGFGYGLWRISIEVLLILAAAIAGGIARSLGYSYKELEEGVIQSLMKGMPAMLIVIVVGALIGSWIAAGIIPMFVYFGLKIISPKYFLLTACLVCSMVSVFTGTSYGTVGTVGVAFIGIAQGIGISLPQAAGAIIAGAYFGDKISPFSDTTNLAPIAAQSNLFDHIKHTLWTTMPAWVLGLLVYFFLGLRAIPDSAVSFERIELISTALHANFRFHWSLLVPPAIMLYATLRRFPVIPGMLLAAGVATLLAIFVQHADPAEAVRVMVSGFKAEFGIVVVDTLLSRGGMLSMMDVTLIAFCAFAFGGIVQRAGMLDELLRHLLSVTRTAGSLIASTIASCLTVALITGSSFLSILIPGELFAPAYKRRNLAAKNLSRTTEDSATVVMPLIPWSIAGVFMSGTLGVSTTAYAVWAIMCYSGVFFALFYAFTGIAIAPKRREDETIPGS